MVLVRPITGSGPLILPTGLGSGSISLIKGGEVFSFCLQPSVWKKGAAWRHLGHGSGLSDRLVSSHASWDDFTSTRLSSAALQLVFLAGTFALLDTFQKEALTQQEQQRQRRASTRTSL